MSVESGSIVLSNVSKTYTIDSQEVNALRSVSIEIPRGNMVAVTGKSGAGKSTLLHIIGTLDRPSSGSISLGGTDLTGMNDYELSAFRNCSIGFVFQMNNLLGEFSALENIMLPGLIGGHKSQAVKERAMELLQAVGLEKRSDHRPGELSGGEQQRVAIARSLLMAPPVLLADEPTGNLDKKTSMSIQDLLLDLCSQNQVTMILVTHDGELASRLPHQVVMEDGEIMNINW